jgi:hypothetical protein
VRGSAVTLLFPHTHSEERKAASEVGTGGTCCGHHPTRKLPQIALLQLCLAGTLHPPINPRVSHGRALRPHRSQRLLGINLLPPDQQSRSTASRTNRQPGARSPVGAGAKEQIALSGALAFKPLHVKHLLTERKERERDRERGGGGKRERNRDIYIYIY